MRLPRDSNISLRAIIYPNPDDDESWLAHCLEMDLLGDGETVEEAIEDLLRAISGQIRHAKGPDQIFFPAPREIWAMLTKCKPLPNELVLRAVRNALGRPPRYGIETSALKKSYRRIEPELATL